MRVGKTNNDLFSGQQQQARGAGSARAARSVSEIHEETFPKTLTIAKRKAVDWIRHEKAAKRGGDKTRDGVSLDEVIHPGPTPESSVELLDEIRHLMDVVLKREDATLQLIALRKLAGRSNREIAAELSLATRTVDRKMELIRILWTADADARAQGDE